jgi:hypothetical protein
MTTRRWWRALALAVTVAGLGIAAARFASAAPAPVPAQIDRNGVLILLRTTLLALDDADKTGNYTTFRDLAAPGFAASNTAAKLGEIFAGNRRDGIDLSGVAVLDPQLTVLPEIEPNGMMRMAGFFPSVPKQVNFELLYQPVNGQWRLFGISVNVGPSGPIAPMPPPPQPPSPPPPSPPPPSPPPVTPKATKSEDKRKLPHVSKPAPAHGTPAAGETPSSPEAPTPE